MSRYSRYDYMSVGSQPKAPASHRSGWDALDESSRRPTAQTPIVSTNGRRQSATHQFSLT
ncbi:MAG TPA: hypothetical protein VFF29_02820 [Bacteroidota bacterium]|nr:hypothetical protein [Bacteroidota bacterium]